MALAVAMLLWAFDIEVFELGGCEEDRAEFERFGVGTLTPDKENAIRLRKRRF